MTLQEIKSLDIMSAAKIYGAMGFIAGIIMGISILIFGTAASGALGFGVGLLGFIMAVVLYTIIGFVGGLVGAFIYNIIAGFIGGIKIELK
ncbi:MAG: hypothetical protein AB1467_06445 [Candidatus Diapherotrites archaeon]